MVRNYIPLLRSQTNLLPQNPPLTVPERNLCPQSGVQSDTISPMGLYDQSNKNIFIDTQSSSNDLIPNVCLDPISQTHRQPFQNEIISQDG
jgi:hypothetical protein